MPEKSPKLYDLKKTTIVFTFASLILTGGLVAMVMQDSTREWKSWQREFMEYNREQTAEELDAAKKAVDAKALSDLKQRLEIARTQENSHPEQIQKAKEELARAQVDLTKARTRFQDLKQNQESDRYFFEEHRAREDKEKTEKYAARLKKRAPELADAKFKFEVAETAQEQKEAGLAKLTQAVQDAGREMSQLLHEQTILEKKEKKLSADWVKAILNAPMLDFIRPTLQIQQIVLENLHDDFYFSRPQKVDRCITCHLGIDQKGFEDAPGPFKSHPRLDLFLTSSSPHPMEEFGCTSCHGGSGHSVSFTTAAHTPQNKEQAEKWEKEYHWHPMKHWADKMLPLNHSEASCAKCHSGAVNVPQAPKLNEGRHLAQTFGCYGCHKVEGFERWKVGPGLDHVQSKLEGDWIVRWLQNPREFRPSTKMPRIFHLSNTSDPESTEKSNAAIAGIAAYLLKNSEPVSLTQPPVPGHVDNGAKLVKELGCAGCHTVGGAAANDHGPELTGLGSKVKPEWLFSWLKDPKHYYPETRMPNLRLSDQEASDITAYLLGQRNEKFESIQPPRVKPEVVDEMVMTYLTGSMRREQAQAEMQKMNPADRLEFVGKKAITHQGCYGCHSIKGFEDAKPIGTELTEEGSKEVEKFYFGFVHLEDPTRQAWFHQKLKEPRSFDQGKELNYLEKLRMPQFDFTDEQAESLITFLLSLQKAHIPLEMKKTLSIPEKQIEEGRLIVEKFNCNGCHTLDGKEGKIRVLYEEKGNAPPIITGEGKKVQPQWLYHFLNQPSPIRPWLQIRMPTFGFEGKQLDTLVQYFNHLDGVQPSFGQAGTGSPPEETEAGQKLFQTFQCIKCHKSNPEPGLSASFLAPNLVPAKERLRPEWVLEWLRDPQALQPGTMMPTFFADGQSPATDILEGDAGRQIKALRDYLWVFKGEEAGSAAAAQA